MSNEFDVSLSSAQNVYKNIDKNKYIPICVFWDKKGGFFIVKSIDKYKDISERKEITPSNFKKYFDIAFPVTHGKYGEDGILQSLFEIQKIPYCGCRVLSSALCMDKGVFKAHLLGHLVPQTKFKIIDFIRNSKSEITGILKEIKNSFSFPLYVKPANSGSSVGITKISNFSKINYAIHEAYQHDSKIIIEEGLVGHRELEVAVLGNNDLVISCPGELILTKEFYDYDDKYKKGMTKTQIPAQITKKQEKEIRDLASRVYKLCDCTGFARIDFFLKNNNVYINEINTLPGFTNISMYPMLMEAEGVSYKKLISRIIKLAE